MFAWFGLGSPPMPGNIFIIECVVVLLTAVKLGKVLL